MSSRCYVMRDGTVRWPSGRGYFVRRHTCCLKGVSHHVPHFNVKASLSPLNHSSLGGTKVVSYLLQTHTHTHTQIILEKSFLAISSDRLWIPEVGMTWPLPFASPSPGPRAPQPTHPATWKAMFFGEWVCKFCTRTARSSILTLDRRVFGQPSLCFRFPLYQVQQQHFLRFRYTNTSKQF